MVRHRILIPAFVGSIPTSPARLYGLWKQRRQEAKSRETIRGFILRVGILALAVMIPVTLFRDATYGL